MSPTVAPFKLSALLSAHSNDVRSLAGSSSSELFSTSRDRSARVWSLRRRTDPTDDPSGGWDLKATYSSSEWINSSAWLAHPTERSHAGFLVLGGQDSIINIFDLSKGEDEPPVQTLLGHRMNVCALALSHDSQRLVSSSWDGTARVWSTFPDFECLHELDHGSYGVWDVLSLGGDLVATACADGLVRLWEGATVKRMYKGHQGPCRSLCQVSSSANQPPDLLFASSSNDGTIRIWDVEGKPHGVLRGHDGDFVYSLAQIGSNADGGLVSSGEDGIIRVWSEEDGSMVQEVLVPALSVWCVLSLANGDLAAGCSDNNVWIFTRDPVRAADDSTRKMYEAGLSERQARLDSRRKPPTSTAPLPLGSAEELEKPGKKEGELKLVETDGVTHAWQWTSGEWNDLGQVVSGMEEEGSTREKTEFGGRLYDFVLSVDVSDEAPHLKLAFDAEDDLLEVATAFVAEHKLPESYVERIVDFMRQSMGA